MKQKAIGAIAGLAVWMALLGCKRAEPFRPPSVPQSAVWAGGIDGGAFFQCTPSAHQEANFCTVWEDSNGEVYMKGRYLLEVERRGATASELKYVAADGNRIYLANEKILVPARSPLAPPARR